MDSLTNTYEHRDADGTLVATYDFQEMVVTMPLLPEGHTIMVKTGKPQVKNPCPACSGESTLESGGLYYICQRCGGRHGNVDYQTYRTLVSGRFSEDPNVPQERWEYYDFTVTCPAGPPRRSHGWRDKDTTDILQTG